MILLVMRNCKNSSATKTTLQSLLNVQKNSNVRVCVSFVGESYLDNATISDYESQGLEIMSNFRMLGERHAFIGFVESGTTFDGDAFEGVTETDSAKPLQIFVEGSYGYRLNSNVSGCEYVDTAQLNSIWVGSTLTLFGAELFSSVLQGDMEVVLTSGILFAEALSVVGGFHVRSGIYSPRTHEDRYSTESFLFEVDWYMSFVRHWADLLSRLESQESKHLRYVQRMYLYLLQARLRCNIGVEDKKALHGLARKIFLASVGQTLKQIETDTVLRPPRGIRLVGPEVRTWLLRLKYGGNLPVELRHSSTGTEVMLDGDTLGRLSDSKVNIDVMDVSGSELLIEGRFPLIHQPVGYTLIVQCGDEQWELPDEGVYADVTVFGERIVRHRTFSISLPLAAIRSSNEVEFYFENPDSRTEVRQALPLTYPRPMSKLATGSPKSYWAIPNQVILRPGDRFIGVQLFSRYAHLRAEAARVVALLKTRDRVSVKSAVLRAIYFLTAPFFQNQTIWMYADRVVRGGDNGEYAYDFARRQNDGIKKYYLLAEGSQTADEFRRNNKPYLKAGTLRQRILFLHSNQIYATRVNPVRTFGLDKDQDAILRDLYSFRVIYINHGLVVDKLDYVLNRRAENISKICVVSSRERSNLEGESYGYSPESIIETGFARFDGLRSQPKKQVLLAPTWRSYLHKPQRGNRVSSKSQDFTDSNYFKTFNSLINNEPLNDALKNLGFTLTYLLHPNTSSQRDDFKGASESVKVVAAEGDVSYEQLLRESAIMITDFSGVQFDFAFMRKPVIYYHPPSIPAHYDEASFNYHDDGFGEVAEDEAQLVSRLTQYLVEGCTMRDEYIGRVNSFFTHLDHENSRRIYEVGLDLHS